ncbi:MAG: tRNA pseudouridine(13) synthase TruD [bacterium]
MTLARPAAGYLTAGLPGTGGLLREAPEDFRVEEIPLAPPGESGEHLYLWVEKRGLPTLEAVRRLARLLEVPEREVGYAGLKDARAVTRQWCSFRLPGAAAERRLARSGDALGPGIRILSVKRGRAKLRRGAHAGNRFRIRIRGTGPGAGERARAILEALRARGAPNAFGAQRFGARGHSAEAGLALALGRAEDALAILLGGAGEEDDAPGFLAEARRRFAAGDYAGAKGLYPAEWRAERRVLSRLLEGQPPERAVRALPRRERGLLASAVQAALFNECLARRLGMDAHDRLLPGDVAVSHRTGKVWRIGDPEKEAGALARFEISPAGPLFGERMLRAGGEPGRMEMEGLTRRGLSPERLAEGLADAGVRGGRRPYRARPGEIEVEDGEGDLVLGFVLPPGAYATEVLREVTKTEPPLGEAAGRFLGGGGLGGLGAGATGIAPKESGGEE